MTLWVGILFISLGVILFLLVIGRTIYRCFTYHGCCGKKENKGNLMTLKSNKSTFFDMEVVKPEPRDSMLQPDLDPLDAEKLALQHEKEELNEILFDPSKQRAVDEYDPDGYYPQEQPDGTTNVGYDEPDAKANSEPSPAANNGTAPVPGYSDSEQEISTHHTYQKLDTKDMPPHTGDDYTALVSGENSEGHTGIENPNFKVDSPESEHLYEITIETV